MADRVILEVRVPEALDDRLEEIAREDGRSKAVLMAGMLRHCMIDNPDWAADAAHNMRALRERPTRALRRTAAPAAMAPDVEEKLRELAESAGVDAGSLMEQILADVLGIDLDEIAIIEASQEEVRNGNTVAHEEVMKMVERVLASRS